MNHDQLRISVIEMWRRHNDILLFLLAQIPQKGMTAVPSESKGRDVTAQFAHLARVRSGWVEYFNTNKYPQVDRYDKTKPPTKAQLKKSLIASSKGVEHFLEKALAGNAKPKMFGGDVMRWCGYLIAHESHHRGQIMLALKQNRMRFPEKISIEGVWGKWIYGK